MPESEPPEILRAKINGETAQIAWTGVQRFFAQGKAVYVHPDADLVDVAMIIAQDHGSELEALMQRQLVQTVSDAQAREWLEADAMMWSVVIKPWVLVQPIVSGSANDPDA